jgi:hypothetical protein
VRCRLVRHRAVKRVLRGQHGRLCAQLGRAVAQPAQDDLDALQVVVHGEVRHAVLAHHQRAAELHLRAVHLFVVWGGGIGEGGGGWRVLMGHAWEQRASLPGVLVSGPLPAPHRPAWHALSHPAASTTTPPHPHAPAHALTCLPSTLLSAWKPVRMMGWSERCTQRRPRRARYAPMPTVRPLTSVMVKPSRHALCLARARGGGAGACVCW